MKNVRKAIPNKSTVYEAVLIFLSLRRPLNNENQRSGNAAYYLQQRVVFESGLPYLQIDEFVRVLVDFGIARCYRECHYIRSNRSRSNVWFYFTTPFFALSIYNWIGFKQMSIRQILKSICLSAFHRIFFMKHYCFSCKRNLMRYLSVSSSIGTVLLLNPHIITLAPPQKLIAPIITILHYLRS